MARNQHIVDFATAQTQYNQQIGTGLDGIAGDIKTLNDTIAKLQSTPPELDPADQALLDDIQAQSAALADRVKSLDELTPPTVPPDATAEPA